VRVLDRGARLRVDLQAPRGLEEDVGRRLAARPPRTRPRSGSTARTRPPPSRSRSPRGSRTTRARAASAPRAAGRHAVGRDEGGQRARIHTWPRPPPEPTHDRSRTRRAAVVHRPGWIDRSHYRLGTSPPFTPGATKAPPTSIVAGPTAISGSRSSVLTVLVGSLLPDASPSGRSKTCPPPSPSVPPARCGSPRLPGTMQTTPAGVGRITVHGSFAEFYARTTCNAAYHGLISGTRPQALVPEAYRLIAVARMDPQLLIELGELPGGSSPAARHRARSPTTACSRQLAPRAPKDCLRRRASRTAGAQGRGFS
jgi:hypothetical protein